MALIQAIQIDVPTATWLLKALAILLLLRQAYRYIYNIYLHPLRTFPGPKFHAASQLPYVTHQLRGHLQHHILSLHQQYGDVVRVLPNELSFASADAARDIYGHRRAGEPRLHKFPHFYGEPMKSDAASSIIEADDATHSRMRRVFAHAFSERALKMQEPLLLTYVDRLIANLHGLVAKEPGHRFEMVSMLNYTTFDIMGDLTFGEPLNLLTDTTYHGWIQSMFASFKFGAYLHSIRYYPFLEKSLFKLLRFTPMDRKRKEHGDFSRIRVDKRLERKDARPDIWGLVMARDGETGLSREEMYKNAGIFMLAGTETTATLLSGLTYHLMTNEHAMKRLVDEIRGACETEDQLTMEKLAALPYLHACIEEGLRMYPPVSNGLPRVVPPEGAVIDGISVPPSTVVYSHNLSTYRNPKNFRDAFDFVPERWLDESYASDLKHALNPFSVGPRACLGKNLAYHEIRLILAKVLWHFDLALCEKETGYFPDTKKIYVLWEKGPLLCTLKPVER